jgi:hypothetical protein
VETSNSKTTSANQDWASLVAEVRAIRGALTFSKRSQFDDALRPILGEDRVIAYPDAIYHITREDVVRAKGAIHDVK